MRDREADRLYRRFREQGDVAALGSLFDETAPELLRVAAHLVRDLHAAEDLVQETFVAAIRGRESFDRTQGVKPWLFGILVRQAALHHRRRARIADEAPDVHATSEAGPMRVASEREWMGELERAVHQLPPLYRDVVERHLRLEQGSQEIAQALERAPGTVRVQIHRGLELLRKALPAGFAASCGIDADVARGLAAVRESVLTEAGQSSVALTTAAATGAGTLSALAGLKLVASLAVLVAIGVWFSTSSATVVLESEPLVAPPHIDSVAAVASNLQSDESFERRAEIAPSVALEEQKPVASAVEAPVNRWILRGTLTSPAAVPLASTSIVVRPIGGRFGWPDDAVVLGQPDSEGRFELDLTPLFVVNAEMQPSELVVRADQRECVPAENRIDVPVVQRTPPPNDQEAWIFATHIELVRAAAVSGRVVDEHGAAIANVETALLDMRSGAPDEAPLDVVRSAADGSFRLRTNSPGPCAVLAVRDSMQPAARLVDVEYRRDGEPVILEMGPGARIAGYVNPGGLSVHSGVTLLAFRGTASKKFFRVGSQNIEWDGGASFAFTGVRVKSSADGSFEFAGLSRGKYMLYCTSGPADYVYAQEPIDVIAPAEGVEFRTSWSRVVCVVESGGKPVSPADVRVGRQSEPGRFTPWLWVEPSGERAIVLRGGESYRVEARAGGYTTESLEFVAPLAGGESTQRIALVRASTELTITISASTGAKLHRASVAFSALEQPDELDAIRAQSHWWPSSLGHWNDFVREVPIENGSLVLQDLPAGLFEVRIELDSTFGALDSPWFHEPLVIDLAANAAVTRSVVLIPAGRLRVELSGPDGMPRKCAFALNDSTGRRVPIRFLTRLADGSSLNHLWFLGDAGQRAPALSDPALPPGDYTLVLEPTDRSKQEHPIRIVGGEITTLDLVLRDD